MSQLTRFNRPIVRHLAGLHLVVRFDGSGIAIRAYRRRTWKRVTWAQLASLADDSRPVVKACEVNGGLEVLKSMGARIASDRSEVAPPQ